MATTPVLLPGNMCDSRLWHAAGGAIGRALVPLGAAVDADLTRDTSIAGMASRCLATTGGRLLPVGFSLGAIVALEMARQAPDRIAGAVLIGLNAGPDLPERAAARPSQQREVCAEGLDRILVEELKPRYLAEANRRDPGLRALLRDMALPLGTDVFVRQSQALMLRGDLTPTLATLTAPILLMCGAEDVLCPPAWHQRWAALARAACLIEVSGAGHMVPLEAPLRVAEEVERFIEQRSFS